MPPFISERTKGNYKRQKASPLKWTPLTYANDIDVVQVRTNGQPVPYRLHDSNPPLDHTEPLEPARAHVVEHIVHNITGSTAQCSSANTSFSSGDTSGASVASMATVTSFGSLASLPLPPSQSQGQHQNQNQNQSQWQILTEDDTSAPIYCSQEPPPAFDSSFWEG